MVEVIISGKLSLLLSLVQSEVEVCESAWGVVEVTRPGTVSLLVINVKKDVEVSRDACGGLDCATVDKVDATSESVPVLVDSPVGV